ncbi:MAG: aminotransferase class III-fold pyridoxal phosphate-dependent enzyme, partial [Lachnospiraceae bacterium]|nr:aminotransferase class III-fold pyridoxal phosphate-dependent enzyme [Lachnospiraceae bacterium]
IDLFEEQNILENVKETGAYLYDKLDALAAKYDFIKAHRGVGLMQGLECGGPVGDIINRAIEKGLLLINAGTNVIRFIPPLIVSKADVDDMISIVDACFDEMERR